MSARAASIFAFLLAFGLPLVAADKAAAQGKLLEGIEECNSATHSPDKRIAACTVIIDSRAGTAEAAAMAYNNRGAAFAEKEQLDSAIKDFSQAADLDPSSVQPLNNRGIAYQKKGEYDRAIADFSAALKINPQHANALANRAVTYEKKGDHQNALSDFDEAIKLQPKVGSLWNERCWIRAITGALQEALTDCNEAIRLGTNAARLDSRALVYLKLGEWNKAIADYNAALRLNPRLASSHYGRGVAKHKSGDTAGGDADIAAATALNGNIAKEFERYGVSK